jgi:hypothetical protein
VNWLKSKDPLSAIVPLMEVLRYIPNGFEPSMPQAAAAL